MEVKVKGIDFSVVGGQNHVAIHKIECPKHYTDHGGQHKGHSKDVGHKGVQSWLLSILLEDTYKQGGCKIKALEGKIPPGEELDEAEQALAGELALFGQKLTHFCDAKNERPNWK